MPTACPQRHQASLCANATLAYTWIPQSQYCMLVAISQGRRILSCLVHLPFLPPCPECGKTPFACISMAWMSLASPFHHTYTTSAPDCIDTPFPVVLATCLHVLPVGCFYLFFVFACCLHVSCLVLLVLLVGLLSTCFLPCFRVFSRVPIVNINEFVKSLGHNTL